MSERQSKTGFASCCLLALALTACSDEAEIPPDPTGGTGGGGPAGPCEVGETATPADTCCPAGTLPLEDGSCIEPGIPADMCAEGFVANDSQGCDPVLPAMPCGRGEMAIPGETSCREVMPCGSGTWGDIPVDSNTQYVDAAFMGTSTGSDTAPWTTITEALAAVSAGGTVAIAAGSYDEDLNATNPVSIIGRCPSMVEINGQGGIATVILRRANSLLSGVAVTSPSFGVVLAGGDNIVVDRVWVHDTARYGIEVEDTLGPTSAVVQGSLVEAAADAGVITLSAELTLRETVIRDTQFRAGFGRGFVVRRNPPPQSNLRGAATIERSVIIGNRNAGIIVEVSDLTMTGSVVSDTLPNTLGEFGRGVEIQSDQQTGEASTVTIRQSVIERNVTEAIQCDGSTLAVEHTVVRDTSAEPASGRFGTGITLQNGGITGAVSNGTIVASVLSDNTIHGVSNLGSVLTMDSTVVRDTRHGMDLAITGTAAGLAAQDEMTFSVRAISAVRGSRFERNGGFGIRNQGSDMTLESSLIIDTLAQADLRFGVGFIAPDSNDMVNRSMSTLRGVVVERARYGGMAIQGGDALIENSVVRDTLPRELDQANGNGIVIMNSATQSNATISDVLVEGAYATGISVYFSAATIERTTVRGVAAEAGTGQFGDGIAVIEGSAQIINCHIEGAERAGVSAFSGEISLADSTLECNAIQLSSQTIASEARFSDAGGNVCGCGGATEQCRVLSSSLDPPGAID
jgi:hypothetical protein